MVGFYEVQHSDGAHVYYAAVLTGAEIDALHDVGFVIVKHAFERNPSKVYPLHLD